MAEVELKKFRYVLDWFEITTKKVNVDSFDDFQLQYRQGSWFLMHFIIENGKRRNVYEHDFQLSDPWEAVAKLGDKLKHFSNLHSINGKEYQEELMLILNKGNELLNNK